MSRTTHHTGQKIKHLGEDFGYRYNCNKCYSQPYSKYGRKRAAKERRETSKELIRIEEGDR